MKLWLDDERPAPEGWRLVKTAGEALTLLLRGGVKIASLDHDLGDEGLWDPVRIPRRIEPVEVGEVFGCSEDYDVDDGAEWGFAGPVTGYDLLAVVEALVVTGQLQARDLPREFRVHSANPVGAERMRSCIATIERLARTERFLLREAAERGLTVRWEHDAEPDSVDRRPYRDRLDSAIQNALINDQIYVYESDGCIGRAGRIMRFTTCELYRSDPTNSDEFGKPIATGYAFCGPGDNFSRAEGRRLSLERALGL